MNKRKIIKELLLFFIGLCIYTTIEVWFRSFSFRLMGIVGGLIMIIEDKINDEISWDIPLIIQMLFGGVIVTIFELLSGEFALHILNVRMWDYSGQWMAMCDNLICPLFSFIWVILSGIAIILCDAINYYVLHEEQQPYYRRMNGNMLFQMPKRICGGLD